MDTTNNFDSQLYNRILHEHEAEEEEKKIQQELQAPIDAEGETPSTSEAVTPTHQ